MDDLRHVIPVPPGLEARVCEEMRYAAIAPGKTPEQLSWFVENVVVRKLQGLRGVGSESGRGSGDGRGRGGRGDGRGSRGGRRSGSRGGCGGRANHGSDGAR